MQTFFLLAPVIACFFQRKIAVFLLVLSDMGLNARKNLSLGFVIE